MFPLCFLLFDYALGEIVFSQGLGDGFSTQCYCFFQLDVGRGASHLDDEVAGLDVPLALALIAVETELLGIELDLDGLAFAWLQGHAGEALKGLGLEVRIVGLR